MCDILASWCMRGVSLYYNDFFPQNLFKEMSATVESRFPLCISECYALPIYSWRSYQTKAKTNTFREHPQRAIINCPWIAFLLLHVRAKIYDKGYIMIWEGWGWVHLFIPCNDKEGSLFWSHFVSIDIYELREGGCVKVIAYSE